MTMRPLYLTNTMTRRKELFVPIHEGHVGMYVCGPTVYGDAHLGHARPGVTYDVLFRLLKHLGYKVRYVRNITDVGHLEHDADEGEDKIAKKARLEELEPMEVVQYYTERYHEAMRLLNVESPSIEPRASGHIIEQIETVKKILEAGYAYESNGSVYFDVEKYNRDFHYGVLSGRTLDATLEGTRLLDGQSDKKAPYDFAIWKRAEPEHIMRWPSPWGEGFPGWHLECSVMGEKYLGREFDIHGGGMDLMFPHHECEIAQNEASRGTQGVHYWVHNNMITINGQKMGKSLGNFITLPELFSGQHPTLSQAYTPMTVRFFILQAHYRSTLDFSNEALQAAEKGYKRLMQAARALVISEGDTLSGAFARTGSRSDAEERVSPSDAVRTLVDNVWEALCDDLNTPVAIAHLFEAVKLINGGHLSEPDQAALHRLFDEVVTGVLGLRDEEAAGSSGKAEKALEGVMDLVLEDRRKARAAKDWAESDRIRDLLASFGITVKDTKDGATWTLE
ncbi:MAG: cysteine--tRNA ligase [Bacteroidales bacterium]|nr:cysteine--tRNA ligase [Bacteroidales bacterium]